MAQFQGALGWAAAAIEAVAYGTLGTPLVYLQGISASMNLIRDIEPIPTLGSIYSNRGLVTGSYVQGDIVTAYTREQDDVDVLYGAGSSSTGAAYVFGANATVDHDSFSFFGDLGGVEYDFAGLVPISYRWDLNSTGHSTLTTSVIGRSVVKYGGAARSTSLPPTSEIVMPGGLGTISWDGTAIGSCKSATITVNRNMTGWDNRRLGSAVLTQPIRNERAEITAEYVVTLDSASGNNTVALLDAFIADTGQNTVTLGGFALGGTAGTYIMGDMPNVGRGLRDVTIRCNHDILTVTTT